MTFLARLSMRLIWPYGEASRRQGWLSATPCMVRTDSMAACLGSKRLAPDPVEVLLGITLEKLSWRTVGLCFFDETVC